MSSPPGVVHVIAPQAVGGAESVVRGLAATRRAAGFETTVVALVPPGEPHPFVKLLERDGTPVIAVPATPRRYVEHVRELAKAIERLDAQIVHTHIYHADVIGWLAMRRRCALVSTVHGISGTGIKNALYLKLDFTVLRRFDAVICVSRALEARLVGAGIRRDRLHRIPNALVETPLLPRADARARLGLPQEGACVGFVGRLSFEKGPDLFVEALSKLPDGVIGALVGDGPEREAIEQRAQTLGIADRIRFVGAHPDAAGLLSAFDVMVLSSRSEASPMILFESMAAGVPMVAFGVGEVAQVLDEETGWLVEAGDVPGLGRSVSEALSDPGRAAARALAGQQRVRNDFGAAAWIRRVEAVYTRCLEEGRYGVE